MADDSAPEAPTQPAMTMDEVVQGVEATIHDSSLSAEEAHNSALVSLADLCAKGTSQYAQKHYEEAADYYARASELQAEVNGEMDPQNGEVLFLYGRSLFRCGQGKSDVLGGRAQGEKKKSDKKKAGKKDGEDRVAEEGVKVVTDKAEAARNGNGVKKEDEKLEAKKPLFQFTGDENFEDSDEEVEEEEGDEEEEDDLAAAFDVLDLARVLFTRKLDQPQDEESKGKDVGDSSLTKHIKERLADTHDLLAEIALENERFPNAVTDFRSSLVYKEELYPQESEIIAEAHFKLSLALEFASITTSADDAEADGEKPKESHIDEAMRQEAAIELELAMNSTTLKLQNKEVELASCSSPDENEITRKQITEVKEILADMEQRLVDLRAPPVDINAALNGPTLPSGGIIAATLGESPAEAQKRVQDAKKGAHDLTGLVRKKKAKTDETETKEKAETATNGTTMNGNGKRKAEDAEEAEAKRSKVDESKTD